MADMRLSAVAALLLTVLIVGAGRTDAQLAVNYYKDKCPSGVDAEAIVRKSITSSYNSDNGICPGCIRILFHDAFVQGVDASILINSTGAEQSATPNSNLRASSFAAINDAKTAVEAACPGVVSCADIVVFAARTCVLLTSGVMPPIESGRRDGLVSNAGNVNLPGPTLGVADLTTAFTNVGLTQNDMVILSGAHTLGLSHCQAFNARLYSPTSTDPPYDAAYAQQLKAQCPQGTTDTTITVNMDPQTPGTFDNKYYGNLLVSKGLFTSDESLFTDSTTTGLVQSLATGNSWRSVQFPASFKKLADIGVLTGTNGEIRQFCWKFN